jgi:hypothetical protein
MDSSFGAVKHSIMSRLIGASLVFLAATASACGGDNIVTPASPPQLAISSGDKQFGTPGQALPTPLTVALTTVDGAPLVGDTVSWTVVVGSGSLSTTSVVTDAAGRASVNWTVGNEIGTQSVVASVRWRLGPGDNGFSSFGVPFSADVGPPPLPNTPQPVILHYDGTAWSVALQVSFSTRASNTALSLNSVWGASSSAVFAVGSQCGRSIVLRYDGNAWAPPPAQTCLDFGFANFASVWGSSASDVFAIERNRVTPTSLATSIDRFDGQATWSPQYNHGCHYPCDPYLNAVWSSSPNYVIAVGDSGFVVHYDGTAWTPRTSGTTQHLNAVWGSGSGAGAALFAVGDGGTILSFDGTSWQAQTSGTTQPLYGIWGASPSDVFAVGGGGIILHYDGNAWSAQSSGSTQALRGVWGSSASSVYAVGDATTILRYDGTNWTAQSAGASIDLRGVWGSSPTNVFAVGHPR